MCIDNLCLFVYLQGYRPTVFYPKPNSKPLFQNLVAQCEKFDVPFLSFLPSEASLVRDCYNLVIDALFGFSFKGPLRPEFETIVQTIIKSDLPIASIDIPSGK